MQRSRGCSKAADSSTLIPLSCDMSTHLFSCEAKATKEVMTREQGLQGASEIDRLNLIFTRSIAVKTVLSLA
jgi:hypothetical protein